ncbi:MAG: hypothetical protein ACT4PZ_11265 [Panacagrimonas sp.]
MALPILLTDSGPRCDAAIMRGRLKHSWLENELLNKGAAIVIALRRGGGWPELAGFDARIQEVMELAESVESGFSPAQLVESNAMLASLPEEQRRALREKAHAAYLQCFDAADASQRLRDAAVRMRAALTALEEVWCRGDEELTDSELAAGWAEVRVAAEGLRAALDRLPTGIVLP